MDFELGSPCHGNQKWEGQLRCCGACTSLQLLVVFKIWPWDDDGGWSTLPLKQLFNCSQRVKTYANRQSGGLDSMGLWPIGSMYAIYGNIYHQYTPNVSIYTIHGSYGWWFMAVTCKSPPAKRRRILLPSCQRPALRRSISCLRCTEPIWNPNTSVFRFARGISGLIQGFPSEFEMFLPCCWNFR